MDDAVDTETARLAGMLAAQFALYVRGRIEEPTLHDASGALVRHLVAMGTAPERAIRLIKTTIPWQHLAALPVSEVPGHDPERARDALIAWCIRAYFRERELAKTEGRLREA